MNESLVVDVREMSPRDRHPRIFQMLDGLAPGQSLLLVNDHDPKPLYYQLQAERPGQVEWLPEEEGPERWVIRIMRRTEEDGGPEVTLDVREDVRAGREPFRRIMDAVNALKTGQSLTIINDFEPTPLYLVLGERGFNHETGRTPDGAWRVTFTPNADGVSAG